jgi:hypothetical protein
VTRFLENLLLFSFCQRSLTGLLRSCSIVKRRYLSTYRSKLTSIWDLALASIVGTTLSLVNGATEGEPTIISIKFISGLRLLSRNSRDVPAIDSSFESEDSNPHQFTVFAVATEDRYLYLSLLLTKPGAFWILVKCPLIN